MSKSRLKAELKGKVTSVGYERVIHYGKEKLRIYVETVSVYDHKNTVQEAEKTIERLRKKLLGTSVSLFT